MAREVDITRPRAPQVRRAIALSDTPQSAPPPDPTPSPAPHPAPSDDLDLDLLDDPAPPPATAAETWRGQRSPLREVEGRAGSSTAGGAPPAPAPAPAPAHVDTWRGSQPALPSVAAPLRLDDLLDLPPSHHPHKDYKDPQDHPAHKDTPPTPKPTPTSDLAPFPSGWTGQRRPRLTTDGHLLLHDLYTVRAPLPTPTDFTAHAHKAAHSGPLEATRAAFPTLTTTAALSPSLLAIGYLLLGWVGVALALPLIIALGAAGQVAFRLVRTWTAPAASEDPEATARQYIALLRLRLPNHARDLLALPRDHTPVDIARLLDPTREAPLGAAFNTAGPIALRDYWRPRLALLDDPAWPLGGLLPRRRLHPGEVHIETLLTRQDGDAALLLVHGHARFSYALLPMVRVPCEQPPTKAPPTKKAPTPTKAPPSTAATPPSPPPSRWLVADGELHMRAADIEAMQRLASLHTSGTIDDDQLARACAQINLTRPDINQGLTQKIFTEQQANRILNQLPIDPTS